MQQKGPTKGVNKIKRLFQTYTKALIISASTLRSAPTSQDVLIPPHLTLKTGDPSLTAVRGGWGFDRRTEQQVEEGVDEAELHEEPIADSL